MMQFIFISILLSKLKIGSFISQSNGFLKNVLLKRLLCKLFLFYLVGKHYDNVMAFVAGHFL